MKLTNTIGIDHQSSVTTIAIREANTTLLNTRMVGDGFYAVIPNAVTEGDASRSADLGTEALKHTGMVLLDYDNARSVEMFWAAVARRLYGYLGRIVPVEANGYSVVLSTGAEDQESQVATAVRAAGLEDATFAAPTEAVLGRWLFSGAIPDGNARVIAVVVGETTTQVEAFSVVRRGADARVELRSGLDTLRGLGDQIWRRHIIQLLTDRLIEAPKRPLDCDPAVLSAVRRLAAKLRAEGKVEAWSGGLRNVFAPITLSRQDLMDWPGTREFLLELPAAIARASDRLPGPRPTIVLVGGLGAEWPLVGEAASIAGTVLISDLPAHDTAIGCCWWPAIRWEVGRDHSSTVSTAFAGAAAAPSTESSLSQDRDLVPPWMRREFRAGHEEED